MLEKLNRYLIKVSVYLIMAALIAGMVGCDGDGGYNLPPSQNLEIRTWYDLDAVRDNLAGNHTLMNDLDSTTAGYEELASPTANGGKGWEPIGIYHPHESTAHTGFTGTFDGQGHEIRDLFVNRPDEDWVGLFKYIDDGVIEDVGVTNVTVIGGDYVGALGGSIRDCTVSNSHCSGSVTGNDDVGGMGGGARCIVTDSYFTGSVTGHEYVGGLVGQNFDNTVSKSHFTGDVTGSSSVGGLVGANWRGTVSDSYSNGSVTGYEHAGGLVGFNGGSPAGTVIDSYSIACVTGEVGVGGLVGANDGAVSNSFWDMETSGQTTSAGGTGKNTTEMQDIDTFSGAGWSIIEVALNQTNPDYIWNIVNNMTYPFLNWEA